MSDKTPGLLPLPPDEPPKLLAPGPQVEPPKPLITLWNFRTGKPVQVSEFPKTQSECMDYIPQSASLIFKFKMMVLNGKPIQTALMSVMEDALKNPMRYFPKDQDHDNKSGA